MNCNDPAATGQIKTCPTPEMIRFCFEDAEAIGSHYFASITLTDGTKKDICVTSIDDTAAAGLFKFEAHVLDPNNNNNPYALILINLKADMIPDSKTESIGHLRVLPFVKEKRLVICQPPLLEASM